MIWEVHIGVVMEAYVAKWLTPQTQDLEVWGSSLARRIVSLDRELYSTLSLFTQGFKVSGNWKWSENNSVGMCNKILLKTFVVKQNKT